MINCERYGRGERQVGRCERAGKRGRGAAGWGCARASKRFWRVRFLRVSVMRRMKEPGAGSRLPLLACWVTNFPAFRFVGLLAFRLVDLLGSWRGGGEHSRDAGRRRKIAALQKKGGGHTRLYLSPVKGRRRKEVCPPIVTEQGAEKSRNKPFQRKGIPRTNTPAQGGVDGTPGKTHRPTASYYQPKC